MFARTRLAGPWKNRRLSGAQLFGAHSRRTSMSGSEVSGGARRHGCARLSNPLQTAVHRLSLARSEAKRTRKQRRERLVLAGGNPGDIASSPDFHFAGRIMRSSFAYAKATANKGHYAGIRVLRSFRVCPGNRQLLVLYLNLL